MLTEIPSKAGVEQNSKIEADCIIPAAGLSTRMGEWKLKLPYQGKSIVEHSVDNALKVCSRVLLVTGHRGDELAELFAENSRVCIVNNPRYGQGMVSSVRAGVQQVSTDYFFISHADMPCIEPEVYMQLWQARFKGSVFPGNEEKGGHPVLVSALLKESILRDVEVKSFKRILTRFSCNYLGLLNPSIHFDVDTAEGYGELLEELNTIR